MLGQDEEFFLEFKLELYNIAKYYFSFNCNPKIWGLCEKGILFRAFREYGNSGKHLNMYFEKVRKVIDLRQGMKNRINLGMMLSGRYLLFDPSATMYDGLSECLSSGFFDSDDSPPPEFWLGIKDDILVSFIPSEFIASAAMGVDNSISECIEWYGEEFTVAV